MGGNSKSSTGVAAAPRGDKWRSYTFANYSYTGNGGEGVRRAMLTGFSDALGTIADANPKLAGYLDRFVENIPIGLITEKSYTEPDGTYYYNGMSGKISIMRNQAKNKVDESNSRFSVSKGLQGAIIHEYGHAMFHQVSGSMSNSKHNQVIDRAMQKVNYTGNAGAFGKTISKYASSSPQETFAEAFTDYVMSGSKARPASKAIIDTFLEMY